MSKRKVDESELEALAISFTAGKTGYETLRLTRDYLCEHGVASRWQHLHKDLIRSAGEAQRKTIVLEYLKKIPKE